MVRFANKNNNGILPNMQCKEHVEIYKTNDEMHQKSLSDGVDKFGKPVNEKKTYAMGKV